VFCGNSKRAISFSITVVSLKLGKTQPSFIRMPWDAAAIMIRWTFVKLVPGSFDLVMFVL
jgi:hypothetical protein